MQKSKKVITGLFLVGLISSSVAMATMGTLTGERRDGMVKHCFYNVLGKTYTLTISVTDTCQLTHDF